MLEREGLVQGAPNRGSTVRRFDQDELEELYNIRAALEGHAARAGGARGSTTQRDRARSRRAATAFASCGARRPCTCPT